MTLRDRCRRWAVLPLLAMPLLLAGGCGRDCVEDLMVVGKRGLVNGKAVTQAATPQGAEAAAGRSAGTTTDSSAVDGEILFMALFPGVGLDTYSSACDLKDDPYGACL